MAKHRANTSPEQAKANIEGAFKFAERMLNDPEFQFDLGDDINCATWVMSGHGGAFK